MIRMRTHLIAPPVDPAHPPMNMRVRSRYWEKGGHFSKSAVVNPLVVMIETTWKIASRKDWKRLAPMPDHRLMVTKRVETSTMDP